MKKFITVIVVLLALAGAVTASAKSKVWDKIFEEVSGEPQQTQPAPQQARGQEQTYIVEIKMANGETFRTESPDAEGFDDVEFTGNMKLEQQDGTYYLNSAQVQYIRVTPAK